jgi:DNA repair protein SbcD/Mre11
MSLRILLTSDLHLGMKFAAYPEVQGQLAEERFLCLDRLVERANAASCDLFVVAGDLFERLSMAKRDVDRAAASLGRFAGRLAAVLPGNHDYVGPDDELWRRFRDAAGDRVLVLAEPRPVRLEHYEIDGVRLYPAPCTSKHSAANAVAWVREAAGQDPPLLGIGIAHGSVEGYSPDMAGAYYPMSIAELEASGPRLWLVGHTHLPFSASPAPGKLVLCAGTPEPDGFDCRHEGSAAILCVSAEGEATVQTVASGRFRFADESPVIASDSDLAELERRLRAGDPARTLARVKPSGSLDREGLTAAEELRSRLDAALAYLDWRDEGLRRRVDRDDIDAEYPAGSFPHELLSALAAARDGEALELAWELLQEARQ